MTLKVFNSGSTEDSSIRSLSERNSSIRSRGENTSNKSTEMSLPAYSHLPGKYTEDKSAKHKRDHQTDHDAPHTPRIPSAQQKKTEIPEDDSARAHMDRAGRTEQPREKSGA